MNYFNVLQLFLENLEHEDSFVYLSAIQGNSFISLRKKSTLEIQQNMTITPEFAYFYYMTIDGFWN